MSHITRLSIKNYRGIKDLTNDMNLAMKNLLCLLVGGILVKARFYLLSMRYYLHRGI